MCVIVCVCGMCVWCVCVSAVYMCSVWSEYMVCVLCVVCIWCVYLHMVYVWYADGVCVCGICVGCVFVYGLCVGVCLPLTLGSGEVRSRSDPREEAPPRGPQGALGLQPGSPAGRHEHLDVLQGVGAARPDPQALPFPAHPRGWA